MGDDLPSGASKPAHIQSMTGFGAADGEMSGLSWRWELRSVNGKGLDIKFRIPSGIEGLETDLRKKIRALHRGSILVSLRIDRPSGEETFDVNEEALAALAASFSKIRQYIDCDKPRPEAILTLRGVLSSQTSERELPPEAREAILDSFEEALARLISAREEEGRRVAEILQQRLATLADKVMAISGQTASIRDELAARLKAQLPALLAEHVTEERLAQEAALLAIKADVSEEVDRLNVHTKAFSALLVSTGAVGRRLEFLSQELMREASTLTAKIPSAELKTEGLDLKEMIDTLREQVLNLA